MSIRSAPRTRAFLALAAGSAVVLLLAYTAHLTIGLPGSASLYQHVVYAVILGLATVVLLLRAFAVREERSAWLVFAAGSGGVLCGWILYWLLVEGNASAPFPSPADAGWLSGYVLYYVALILLLRARTPRFRRGLLLDGAIGVLALAAFSAAIVFDQVIEATGGSTAAVLTSLAYPLADLVLISTVVTVFALSGWRPDRSWAVLGVAFSIQVVADSIYLYRTADGTWEQGALLDLAWPLATLLLALAAWVHGGRREELVLDGWRTLVVPGGFTLGAVALLVYGSLGEVAPLASVLATATLILAAARSIVAFRRMLQLSERHERALDAALRDHLTGLNNHRAFHEALKRRLDHARAENCTVTLILLDLVGLKLTNDTLGHQAGDERLKSLAARLRGVLRVEDVAYRVGGDEFAVILPGVSAWNGFNLAERLQRELSGDFSAVAPAVSIGVAEAEPGISKDALVKRADAALVEAKSSHRKAVLYSAGLERPQESTGSQLARAHRKTLATALARAVDAKDSYTRSHCETVSETCVMIASTLGLDLTRIAQLRIAGLLHDVGKIGIPDTILQKPAKLTDEEFETMKTHSQLGYSIVSGAGLEEEAGWILHHHERPDGRGYPDGLKGDEIPLESRIILVADAFEAMTSDRPYRTGRPDPEALEELRRHCGTQFDADCVAALEHALGSPRPAGAPLAA